MKTIVILSILGFVFTPSLFSEDVRKPYGFYQKGELLIVSNIPVFTASAPITNGFLYVDGEYISAPYVVSVSNLAVCVNGRVLCDYSTLIRKKKASPVGYVTSQSEPSVIKTVGVRQGGITLDNVGKHIDSASKALTNALCIGSAKFYVNGFPCRSYLAHEGDGGAATLIEKARKARNGDEQAKRELIEEMGLENSLSKVRPDWIQRLANNTNLEIRATRILEAKRLKEQKEKERREQQNPQDKR